MKARGKAIMALLVKKDYGGKGKKCKKCKSKCSCKK